MTVQVVPVDSLEHQCSVCGVAKPPDEFYVVSSHGRRSRMARCKQCHSRMVAQRKRERRIERKYGIPVAEYHAYLSIQERRCGICRTHEDDLQPKGLCVDHDHGTGFVRGLLCARCNSAIAMLNDDPDTVVRAALYLALARRDDPSRVSA